MYFDIFWMYFMLISSLELWYVKMTTEIIWIKAWFVSWWYSLYSLPSALSLFFLYQTITIIILSLVGRKVQKKKKTNTCCYWLRCARVLLSLVNIFFFNDIKVICVCVLILKFQFSLNYQHHDDCVSDMLNSYVYNAQVFIII